MADTDPMATSADADPEHMNTPGHDPPSDDTPETWHDLDFSQTTAATYPPTLGAREQWMGRLDGKKLPFAPWGDRDHPEADPDQDARYKWGLTENYVDGETVALARTTLDSAGGCSSQTAATPCVRRR